MIFSRAKLGTNFGRVQYFGAYQLPEQLNYARGVHDSAWVRLSVGRLTKIHGLAFDIPKCCRGLNTIPFFGVSQDTSPAPDGDEAVKPPLLPIHAEGPTLPTLDFANHLRYQKTKYGFSTASLNDIATMHVRKKTIEAHSERVYGCAGLHIVHRDSSVEILGRWDPRDKACISKLYDASEGSLTRVTFHMGQAERATHVENITVGVTDNPWDCQPLDASLVVPTEPDDCERASATRTFDCTQDSQVRSPLLSSFSFLSLQAYVLTSSKRVAWWFTFGYDDITRDHGSLEIQIEEETDLVFAEALEVIQVD